MLGKSFWHRFVMLFRCSPNPEIWFSQRRKHNFDIFVDVAIGIGFGFEKSPKIKSKMVSGRSQEDPKGFSTNFWKNDALRKGKKLKQNTLGKVFRTFWPFLLLFSNFFDLLTIFMTCLETFFGLFDRFYDVFLKLFVFFGCFVHFQVKQNMKIYQTSPFLPVRPKPMPNVFSTICYDNCFPAQLAGLGLSAAGNLST